MLKTILCTLALGAAVACSADTTGDDISRNADQYLQALSESGRFSGTALLARDGQTLFVKGYGFADEKAQLPNSASTRFPAASITKTFTATMVLQLQKRGSLAISDPMCKYVEPCPPAWQSITLRHLLMHTSGIPNYASAPDFESRSRTRRSADEIIATFRDLPLEFAPGARYHYSNSGYFLLGTVLEKVSGRTYATLLADFILKPLGMSDSGCLTGEREPPALATGYRPHGANNAAANNVDPSWLFAAGCIYSTVEDLHKWERALSTDALLPRSELEAMWSKDLGEYGYGWQILPPSPQTLNRSLVLHAGGIPGFSTDLLRYPNEHVTVIILANLNPVGMPEVSRSLSAIVFGEHYAMPPVRRPHKIDPAIYDTYVGRYEINPAISLDVTREGNQLIVQATGQQRDIAVPESPDTFYSRISPSRLTFVKDDSGKVDRLVIHDPDRDIPAIRK